MAVTAVKQAPRETSTVTIAESASLSEGLDLIDRTLARIVMPAAWTAADITFQSSADGITYNDMYDQFGSEYTVTADASQDIGLNLADFIGVRFIKVRSGTSGSAVTQDAARTITLVSVP